MTIIDENSLLERIPKDVNLRFIEPYLCIVFLQGDAHHLPFIPKCFFTIISLNLLHVLKDLKNALLGLKGVLAENGTMSFTMLIKNNRRADKNLKWMLQKTSGVAPKDIKQLQAVFEEIRMLKTFNI